MKASRRRNLVPAIVLGSLAVALFRFVLLSHRDHTTAEACAKHLKEIRWQLHCWVGDGEQFPPDLASISTSTNAYLFVCPGTAHQAGQATAVNFWTDYIYFGKQIEDPRFRIPMIICPPENHGGRRGVVVWRDGSTERISQGAVKSLTQVPWALAKEVPTVLVLENRAAIEVCVPPRLLPIYSNAYPASQPSPPAASSKKPAKT
jgi:hypothetical protein